MKPEIYWMPYSEKNGLWPRWAAKTKREAESEMNSECQDTVRQNCKLSIVKVELRKAPKRKKAK